MNYRLCSIVSMGIVLLPLGARAQNAAPYAAPTLLERGTNTTAIAGSGSVTLQVFVKKDGSHTTVRVLKSTNPADDAAAAEIAQTSRYKPAARGANAVDAYFDFTLNFEGNALSTAADPAAAALSEQSYEKTATDAIGMKQYDAAVAAATHAIELSPQSPTAYYLRGDAYLNDQNAAAAVPDLQKARSLAVATSTDPKTLGIIAYALAVAQLDIGQYADAATSAKDVAPADAAQFNTYAYGVVLSSAVAQANQGKSTEAVNRLESSAAAFPASAAALTAQAAYVMAMAKNPDWSLVKAEAKKALAINPNEGRADFVLGVAAVHQNDEPNAVAYITKARYSPAYRTDSQLATQIDAALALYTRNNVPTGGTEPAGPGHAAAPLGGKPPD
jgi:trimeric autotransporter adhesin